MTYSRKTPKHQVTVQKSSHKQQQGREATFILPGIIMFCYNQSHRCKYVVAVLVSFLIKAFADSNVQDDHLHRRLVGGTANTVCMEQAYGSSLGCTANDIEIVSATNIVIIDDGCKFPGDTVQFSADFAVQSSAQTRYDIGLWFAVDGDQNNDGALTGQCTVATPYHNEDNDFCGDIGSGFNPQNPRFTITAVCRGNANGMLMLPYCSSWRQPGGNTVCSSPTQALPDVKSKCKCDKLFFVNIAVPTAGGSGGGVGDPHFEGWSGKKYDYQGICDLVLLRSTDYGNGTGLDIHVRTSEVNGTSYISAAVIQMGSDKLEVHDDGTFLYNENLNAPLPDHFDDSSLSYIVMDGWLPVWTIQSPRGGTIYIQIFNKMVDVKLSGFLNETVSDSVGLLGNIDSGFLVDRKGEWMFDMEEFGNEWQVRDTEPKLFNEIRHPQYPYRCAMPLVEDVDRRLASIEHVPVQEAEDLCQDTGRYFHECVQDMRLTGNLDTGKYYSHLSKMHL
jgi:hypothetical protein